MANEKRLIDTKDVYSLFDKSGRATLHVADIDVIPRVEAVEVVHAYWIGDEPGDWHCSHCGEYAADGGYEQTRYCPNCGAKMDGGNEDV